MSPLFQDKCPYYQIFNSCHSEKGRCEYRCAIHQKWDGSKGKCVDECTTKSDDPNHADYKKAGVYSYHPDATAEDPKTSQCTHCDFDEAYDFTKNACVKKCNKIGADGHNFKPRKGSKITLRLNIKLKIYLYIFLMMGKSALYF